MSPEEEKLLVDWYLREVSKTEQTKHPYWRELKELGITDAVTNLIRDLQKKRFVGDKCDFEHWASKVRRNAEISVQRWLAVRPSVPLTDKVAAKLLAAFTDRGLSSDGAVEAIRESYAAWFHDRGEWPLMMRHFYDGASAAELAAEAGVSERTIYARIAADQTQYEKLCGDFDRFCMGRLKHVNGVVVGLEELGTERV